MKILLLGATGMVGQAVLRECLADPAIDRIVILGRTKTGETNAKVHEIEKKDLYDLSAIEDELRDIDACLFCLGVSAAGMSESDYRHVTEMLTLSIARTLLRTSPKATFIYVSGAGTNAKSGSMWARVKGETEDQLLALGFPRAYMFRPGFIQPMHGVTSKTRLYAAIYFAMGPLYPVINRLVPSMVTDSVRVAKAMIHVAKNGAEKTILEGKDINAIAARCR